MYLICKTYQVFEGFCTLLFLLVAFNQPCVVQFLDAYDLLRNMHIFTGVRCLSGIESA